MLKGEEDLIVGFSLYTSHRLQPLDVAYSRHLKATLLRILKNGPSHILGNQCDGFLLPSTFVQVETLIAPG